MKTAGYSGSSRWMFFVVVSTVLFLVMGVLAPATEAANDLKEVSVRLNWRIKGEFAPVYAAETLGFFEREGLKVTIGEGRGTTEAILQVATGRDHFGYIPTPQAILAVNQGMPIKMVGTLATETSMGWISFDDIPLNHPKDLEGRTVSIAAASTFAQFWNVFARAFNIDQSKVRVVSPDQAARFGLFLNGDVDILADIFLTHEYSVIAAQTDRKLNVLALADWGFDPIGYGVLTHRDMIASQPDVVRAFLRGLLAGFEYTAANPEEAAALMVQRFPELDKDVTVQQIHQLLFRLARDENNVIAGRVSDAKWQESLDMLYMASFIDKILPLEEYVDYSFLP